MVKRNSGGTRNMPRRSSARSIGLELMMDCQSEDLSPAQIQHMKKCRLEFDNAMAMIKAAQAKARAGKATVSVQKVHMKNIPPPKPIPVLVNQQKQAPRSTSPDVIFVGESPPPPTPKTTPKPAAPLPPPLVAKPPAITTTMQPSTPLITNVQGSQQFIIRGNTIGNTVQGPLRLVPLSSVGQYQQQPPVPVQFQVSKQITAPPTSAPRISQAGMVSASSMLVNSAIMAKRHLEGTQDSAGPAKKKLKKPGEVMDNIGSWVPLDEYYYGKMEGDPSYVEDKGEYRFKCWYCSKMLYNNIKAMMHIQGHIDSGKQHNLDLSDLTQCKHCYKQFDTPFEMQTHVEKVHMNGANVLLCRICERDHESRTALTHHMRQNHNACEMPYICHLCNFRSSMYSDVVDHFKKKHDSSPHILCLYCLKVFKVKFVTLGWGQTQTYYGHLLKHQSKASTKKCTLCRLTFYNVPDVKAHKKKDHQANHKGVLGQNNRYSTPGQVMIKVPESGLQPKPQSVKSLNAPAVSKVLDFGGTRFPTMVNYLTCLECKMSMGTPDHFKKYIECSMCRFATSCSIAYANHMMGFHSCQVSSLNLNIPWERRMESPMYCLCGFGSRYGNKIANHLVYCTKRTCYVDKPDVPMPEDGADEDMDPRRKPGASILDVLGLVKKRTITPKEEVPPEVIRRSSWDDPPILTNMKTLDAVDPTPSQKTENEEIPPELTGMQKWTTVKIKDSAIPSKTAVFLGVEDVKMSEEEDEDMDVSLSDELKATLQNIVDDNIDEVKSDTKTTHDNIDEVKLDTKTTYDNIDEVKLDAKTTHDNIDEVKLDIKTTHDNIDEVKSDTKTTHYNNDEVKLDTKTTHDNIDEVKLDAKTTHENIDEVKLDTKTTQDNIEEAKQETNSSDSKLVDSASFTNNSEKSDENELTGETIKNTPESGVKWSSQGLAGEPDKSPDRLLEDTCEDNVTEVSESEQGEKKVSSDTEQDESTVVTKEKLKEDDVDNLDDNEIDDLLKDNVGREETETVVDSEDKENELLWDSESQVCSEAGDISQNKGDNSSIEGKDSITASSQIELGSTSAPVGTQNQNELSQESSEDKTAETEEINSTKEDLDEESDAFQIDTERECNISEDKKMEETEGLSEKVPSPDKATENADNAETGSPEHMEAESYPSESENKDSSEEKVEENPTKESEDSNISTNKGDDSSSDGKGDKSQDKGDDSSLNGKEQEKRDNSSSKGKGDNSQDKGGHSSSDDRRNHSQNTEGRGDNSKRDDRKGYDGGGDNYRPHSRERDRYDDKERSRNRDLRYDDRSSKSDYRDNRSQGNYRSHGDHHGDRSHDRDWDRNHSRSNKDDRNWRHSDNRSYHGNQDHHNYQGHRDNRSYHGNSQYSRDDRRQGNYHDNYQSNRNYRGGRGGYGNHGGYQGNYR